MAQSESQDTLRSNRRWPQNALFLVGFMGAGKTTVGQELARQLEWDFVDLDDRIVAAEGRSIAEVFAESGEPAFRKAESLALADVLAELRNGGRLIVALGGGAFVQPNNADAIRATGVPVVFLDAPVEELRRRCAPGGALRPLFQDQAAFSRLYDERKGSYLQADFCVNTAGRSVAAVVVEVLTLLGVRNS